MARNNKGKGNELLDKKLFTSLMVVLLVVTIFYLILIFTTGLQIINDKTCRVEHISDYGGKETTNSYDLNDTGEYALQYFNN